jgi:hypothetical protein
MTKTMGLPTQNSDLMDRDLELLEHGIVFETDVPFPERHYRSAKHGVLLKVFQKMKVGNSFTYEAAPQTANYYAKKAGVRIIVRDLMGKCPPQARSNKIRIWRSA